MNIKIIPAPLPYTVDELNEKLRRVEGIVNRVQIDVVGRAFNKEVTIGIEALEKVSTALVFDVQLMVREPVRFLNRCDMAGTDRVLAHVEYMKDKQEFVEQAFAMGMEVGLALDLVTPVLELESVIGDLDAVLLMSVPAGKSGQTFDERVVEKIKRLRGMRNDIPICVDGGINTNNIGACVEAGANEFAVGKFLWESGDIAKAIEKLRRAAAQ